MSRRPAGPLAPALCLTAVAGLWLALTVVPAAQRRAGTPTGRAVARQAGPAVADLDATRVAAFLDADRRRLDYLPGEIVVKFRPGTSAVGRERALASLRGRPRDASLHWRGDVARLVDPAEPDVRTAAARLARQPEVEYAHPNYLRRHPTELAHEVRPRRTAAVPTGIPNDPDYRDLQWNLSLIGMPGAWDINPGGSSDVIVAVIDTGLTTMARTLTRRLWTGQQFETVPLRFDVSPDLSQSRVFMPRDFAFEPAESMLDFEGHGTHVASTIAEDANNAESLAGIAYRTRLMPVKVCVGFWELMLERAAAGLGGYIPSSAGGCASEDIAAGIRYAVDNGARVINLSLGGDEPAAVERDAIQYAISKGAFVATSMGNDFDIGSPPSYPAGYADQIAGMMSVGAVGKSKARAYYSSTGSHIEIAAPGGDSRDGGGEDLGFVWQVTLYPPDQDVFETPRPRFDRYVEVGYIGTSMATPHVSALAALLMSQGVTDPRAIEAVIKATALDLGTPGRDDEFGFGLIQPRTALFGQGIK